MIILMMMKCELGRNMKAIAYQICPLRKAEADWCKPIECYGNDDDDYLNGCNPVREERPKEKRSDKQVKNIRAR